MSGAVAKEIRRDLRRAFGPEALDVIEQQGQAIERMAEELTIQRNQVSFLTKELKDMRAKFALFADMH